MKIVGYTVFYSPLIFLAGLVVWNEPVVVAVAVMMLWFLAIVASLSPFAHRSRPRSPPFTNQITYGDWPFIKNEKGEWVNPETGQIAKSYTWDEMVEKMKKDKAIK